MEHHEDDEHDATTAEEPVAASTPVTKRTPRMIHEGAFATAPFMSTGGFSRPPGFSASSLEYKASHNTGHSAEGSVPVNPKPLKRKKQQPLQEQLEIEVQQQQRHKQRHHVQTRAKGHSGPPPHRISTLEDLEHLTEDEMYRMFLEDPDLYRALMKSAEERREAPTSAPVGARNSRASNGKRSQQERLAFDKEVPYFQWLVILLLLALGIYQVRKSFAATTTASKKRASVTTGGKAKGGKQKKQKNKKAEKTTKDDVDLQYSPNPTNETSEKKNKSVSPTNEGKSVNNDASTSKRSSVNKKKKKSKSTFEPSKKDNQKEHQQKEEQEKKSEPVKGDDNSSSVAAKPTASSSHEPVNVAVDAEEDDGAWQTVAKSKGNRVDNNGKNSTSKMNASTSDPKPSADAKENGQSVKNVGSGPDSTSNVLADSKAGSDGKRVEDTKRAEATLEVDKPVSDNGDAEKGRKGSKKKKKKNNSSADTNAVSPGLETSTSMDDDAALALQLQKEEESLARAEKNTNDLKEEAWEEVTTKKKKGVKA